MPSRNQTLQDQQDAFNHRLDQLQRAMQQHQQAMQEQHEQAMQRVLQQQQLAIEAAIQQAIRRPDVALNNVPPVPPPELQFIAPPVVAPQPPVQPIANNITIVQSPQLPVLPLYDGSTDVNDFLEHFDVLAAASQWTPHAQAQYLYMYLADNPRSTIQQLANNNDINAIKRRLISDYAPSAEKYVHMYEERVPKLNEKPKAFALAIQKLLSRGMPTLTQANKEQLLKNKFMKYLPQQTQLIMKLGPERDWATLVKDVDATIETFGINEINTNVNVTHTRLQKSCNYCKKSGHTIDECFKR
jgi:hypothetical protein